MHAYVQHRPRENQEWSQPGAKRQHVQNVLSFKVIRVPRRERFRVKGGVRSAEESQDSVTGSIGHA